MRERQWLEAMTERYFEGVVWRPLLLEALAVAAVAGFLFFHGLGSIGLAGADEPRYAQVAREMLARHDWITPTLYGHVWLEKPALYYWRAMASYRTFGVHDWVARMPSASFAFWMVALIYFHMRRFRHGAQLDAALITASCAAVIGFSHGASTDMQLAAPFVMGMLGWYAWFETGKKLWLFDFYFFMALGTLAKGPVAPGLAAIIIILFCALRREPWYWLRSIWWPGIALFIAIAAPWYIAVQQRNPQFFRVFLLEHNLERFGTDKYQHVQPLWYYLPVLAVALLPWTFIALPAMWEALRDAVRQWRDSDRQTSSELMGDAFPEFLVIWALLPVLFFTISKSKLPGYILPAIPAVTILTGDYLARLRRRPLPKPVLALHALLCAALVGVALLLPYLAAQKSAPPLAAKAYAGIPAALALTFIFVMVSRRGTGFLRVATLAPLLLVLAFLEGPAAATLDRAYSARRLAEQIRQIDLENAPVAVEGVRRDVEYGLAFYRDHEIASYDRGDAPAGLHYVVVPRKYEAKLMGELGARASYHVGSYPAQRLEIYRVAAR
ncbi:MAG: glycosyltransferase family 39 protein [Acidobacteriaceae bacterium]